MRIRVGVFLIVVIGIAVPQAHSLHWDVFMRFCPIEIIEIPPLIEKLEIPVGCEVIDCCPGCPGPGPIDWRIFVADRFASGAVLRFDGLEPAALEKLRIDGNARVEQGRIVLGPGQTRISGLPFTRTGRVPVGIIQPVFDSAKLAGRAADFDEARAVGDQADEADRGIEILQLRERFIVNRYRVRFGIVPCLRPIVQDRIRLTSNTAGDSAIILADYRTTGGCQDDLIHRATSSRGIGNALTNAACNSEVSVFSDDNAMSFQPGVTTWTDPLGDEHVVPLQPILNAPVSVWVANAGAAVTAANDFANANLLYNRNNVGVQFTPTITDVSGNAAAVAAIGTGCGTAGGLPATAWYTANRINIYYVNSAFTGVNCGVDRNVSYLGTIANLGSLPHEIGHAYGLRPSGSGGHTNLMAGFGNNNIMWGGGPGTRDHFSVGQSFRINVYDISMLNVNADRTGPTRGGCVPNVTTNLCPALALDSLPH